MFRLTVRILLPAALACGLAACAARAPDPGGGDARRGKVLIATVGCGSCHVIPGVPGAGGEVGPSLAHIARRTILGGMLPNTPANMARWLKQPQAVVPGNAMPDMALSDRDARDIGAYLRRLD